MKTEMEKKRNKYLLVILLITVIFYVCIAFDLKVPAPAVAGLKDPAPAVVSEASGESKNEYKVDRTVFDFRETIWGMSKKDVRASESIEPINEILGNTEEKIIYFIKKDTFECFVGYDFVKNKLVKAAYSIFPDNPGDIGSFFKAYENALAEEFGNPIKGDLDLDFLWATSETVIELRVKNVNGLLSLVIGYNSVDLLEWAVKIIEEE